MHMPVTPEQKKMPPEIVRLDMFLQVASREACQKNYDKQVDTCTLYPVLVY